MKLNYLTNRLLARMTYILLIPGGGELDHPSPGAAIAGRAQPLFSLPLPNPTLPITLGRQVSIPPFFRGGHSLHVD